MKRSWQSYLINGILRTFAKRRLPVDGGFKALRDKLAWLDQKIAKAPERLNIQKVEAGQVPVEVLTTGNSQADRVVLYLHGGGFVVEAMNAHREMLTEWCDKMGCTAYMPDYRLAPEHPYPCGPEDCLRAYEWLLGKNVPADRIVIAGDSAGGCYSLVLLQQIRDKNLPMPKAAVLLSPAADLTISGNTAITNQKHDPMFTLQAFMIMRNAYATEQKLVDPYVSPLFGEYEGLPPMKFIVGSTEMLLSDSTRTAEKAKAAGVDVDIEIWEKMPHVFPVMTMLPESAKAINNIQQWLASHGIWGE